MKYFYEQITKKDGITLRGVINTPDDFDKDKIYPTVIFYHGFGGDRNGTAWFRGQNAKYLADRGYISIRFDFSGTNDSDGDFYDMTVSREVDEAEMIHEFAKTKHFVDNSHIYWVGHSLGGVISTLLAYKLKPKAVCLLAPASDMNNPDFIKVMAKTMFEGELEKAKEEKFKDKSLKEILTNIKDADIGGVKLHVHFLTDFLTKDIYGTAKKYNGNVLILRGSRDELVFNDANEKLQKAFPHAKYELIDGADHSFKNEDHRKIVFDKMHKFFLENIK